MKKLLMITPLVILLFFTFSCQQHGEELAEMPSVDAAEKETKLTVDIAISTDGIPIRYEVRGKGKTAIVFVHGWSCNRSYWNEQLPNFAPKYKVVAIDLAGHGESGLGRKEWTMRAFGEDVIAVVKKLDLDRVVLVGHSMGGPVILEAARRIPKRVIGLVGVDTLQDFENTLTQEQIDNWLTPFRSNFKEATRKFVLSMFTPDSNPALVERVVTDMASAPQEVGLGAFEGYIAFHNNEIIRVLQEVLAPITCISSDKWPTNIKTNQRYAPSFQAKIMPGVGHFNMMEDPETFNRLLEETIQEFLQMTKS